MGTFIRRTDYGDPANRTFKIKIDGVVKGFTYRQMTKWVEKWSDPMQTIRNSARYQQLYHEHYKVMMEYIPLKCVSQLKKEKLQKDKILNDQRARYLVDGLQQCILMFEKLKNMDPDEEFYKSFVWESKILFFSFYDFCEPRQVKAETK